MSFRFPPLSFIAISYLLRYKMVKKKQIKWFEVFYYLMRELFGVLEWNSFISSALSLALDRAVRSWQILFVYPLIIKALPWQSAPQRSGFTFTWCPSFTPPLCHWASWCWTSRARLVKNPMLTWPGWPWPAWLSSSQVRSSVKSYRSWLNSCMKSLICNCSDQNDESKCQICSEIIVFPKLPREQYKYKT